MQDKWLDQISKFERVTSVRSIAIERYFLEIRIDYRDK